MSLDLMSGPERQATLRWRIDKDLEVYRFYLDVSVKTVVFLMAVTGAIVSYVLSNASSHVSTAALLFPILMNAGFAALFVYSRTEAKRLFRLHTEACQELELPPFNMNPLRAVCEIFSVMCTAATIGLVLLAVVMWVSPSLMTR
jgi:uncharacterized membrane protein YbjE (DUF340 family)